MSDYLFTGVQWMETALSKLTSPYAGRPPMKKQLQEAQLALETAKEAVSNSIFINVSPFKKTSTISPQLFQHDIHLGRSKGQHSFTYTEPVRDLSPIPPSLKTNKGIKYNQHKFSTDLKHARINYCGLCQGRTHQVSS